MRIALSLVLFEDVMVSATAKLMRTVKVSPKFYENLVILLSVPASYAVLEPLLSTSVMIL